MGRPWGQRDIWLERLAFLGLMALIAYLCTDPIGRSAAQSYATAADDFIEQRVSTPNLLAIREVDLKPGRSETAAQPAVAVDAIEINTLSDDTATPIDFEDHLNVLDGNTRTSSP